MLFKSENLSDERLRSLYEAMLLPRLIEERMLLLLRQGRISKWFAGIGQEAIAVGVTQALRPQDYIFPLHRNLGVFTSRDLPLQKLFAQLQGKATGYTKGRDRSFHFGAPQQRVIGMISHLGAMLGVADGVALAAKLDAEDHIAVAFSGDGGSSEGDFHEALNTAAVWQLPVLFLLENNGYGLSTPSTEQFRCEHFVDKAPGYGMRGVRVDGNNILDVYQAVVDIAARMREDKQPVLLEALTFRMRGHEEASGTAYVPPRLLERWGRKDPVANFEAFLVDAKVISRAEVASLRETLEERIVAAWQAVEAQDDPPPEPGVELGAVYAEATTTASLPGAQQQRLRFVDAISDGLGQAMERHPGLVIMGQDVAEYGGVFKVTEGFVTRFGKERVRNTPLCESAIVGAALGLAIAGRPAVVEMQFADFVTCGFNQIVNNLAKTHYRWGQPVNVTVRMPTGGGVGAGPFHSQSTEAWFAHVPGLKVVYPATAADAKGLLLASIDDPNPVMFFEHKVLYRSEMGAVSDGYYTIPIGEGRVVRRGSSATVITYGLGVRWSEQVVDALGVDVEIIDLRSLLPWDRTLVCASVRKTSRALVVHEDTLFAGIGAEIAASIAETCFADLDAPVLRVGSLDTPVPFNKALEQQFFAQRLLGAKLADLLAY